jgi:plasmid stabilization system protein ParE
METREILEQALKLTDARSWYEQVQPGLGRHFAAEIRLAAERIGRTPLLYPSDVGEVRKYVPNRFPYTLRFILRDDVALIVAVAHQHRQPDYWIDRGAPS